MVSSIVRSSFASSWRGAWALALFGVLMSAWLTVQHGEQARQFLEWRFFLQFQGEHPFQAVFSPVHNYYYHYDMMSLAFIVLGMWAIVSGRGLRQLLWILVPAMFNRETAIVIPFFYLAWHGPGSRQVLRNTAILVAVAVCIKLGISHVLRAHDEMVSLHHMPGFPRWRYNFSFLTLNPELVHTANVFLMLGLTWLLLPWRTADARLRRMMWCFVPYFMGMMVVGNLAEIRIFAEFIPLMALLLASKFFVPAAPRAG